MKRQRAEDGGDLHPARKRRVEYSKADASLAKIYNDLADDVQSVRLKAAGALVKDLSAKLSDRPQRIKDSLGRLVRGLCSGRKAARLGFSVALSEVLRLAFDLETAGHANDLDLDTVTEKLISITQAEGHAKGQEKRDHLIGRRFAFQAVLQSDIALNESTTNDQWRKFVDAVADLAAEKPWIRSECGAMLYEYLESIDVSETTKDRAQAVIASLHEKALTKTPEGVALWLSVSTRFDNVQLPKGVWHGDNPLSSEECVRLKKVMNGNAVEDNGSATNGASTGLRQSQPSFAWKVILSHLHAEDGKAFQHFWDDAVEHGLFATGSSNERRSLGLQIVALAIATAPTMQLKHVLSTNVVHCIVNQRTDSERYLFEAAKATLHQVVIRATTDTDPQSAMELVQRLFDVGAINFDQLTKTKTIDSILSQASPAALKIIIPYLQKRILHPNTKDASQVDLSRRTIATMLLDIVRSHQDAAHVIKQKSKSKDVKLESWLNMLLQTLIDDGYCALDTDAAHPPLSDAHRAAFQSRLTSCLTCLLQHPMDEAVVAVDTVTDLLRKSQAQCHATLSKDTTLTLEMADKLRGEARKLAKTDNFTTRAAMQAYQLLFALSTLQVYNGERESIDVLNDLCSSYQDRGEGSSASAMIIEILLSFLSKPSALFRRLAEQVFSAFAPQLTAESMQSLLDILQQKESLSGQQELFNDGNEEHGEGHDSEEDESESDGEAIDVEDDSDVEIVNGQVVGGLDDEESEEEDGSSDSTEDGAAEDEDEETVFDRKLADALGTQGMEGDSDDDGSEMDDDQMMALDGHLTTIFKERSKQSNKKQDNKDAKENIVHFKNRVLDLLAIYVKTQSANAVALELILPLTTLVRTTSSKPTSEKAFAVLKQYFDACNKSKRLPIPDDPEAYFELLAELHAELKLGGAKLHAHAGSRSSLFLAKVLVALDATQYPRIAVMYAALQSEWYADVQSKVQGSVFTEWTSWSLATRKQK